MSVYQSPLKASEAASTGHPSLGWLAALLPLSQEGPVWARPNFVQHVPNGVLSLWKITT